MNYTDMRWANINEKLKKNQAKIKRKIKLNGT